jgi:hypothetical protein
MQHQLIPLLEIDLTDMTSRIRGKTLNDVDARYVSGFQGIAV